MFRLLLQPVIACFVLAALAGSARGEVTAAEVKEAIENGCKFLEKQQDPDGNWSEYDGEPGGLTAVCTLALLNSGRTKDDPVVAKAPGLSGAEIESGADLFRIADDHGLRPGRSGGQEAGHHALANWLEAHQMRDNDTKGGWTYSERTAAGPTTATANSPCSGCTKPSVSASRSATRPGSSRLTTGRSPACRAPMADSAMTSAIRRRAA